MKALTNGGILSMYFGLGSDENLRKCESTLRTSELRLTFTGSYKKKSVT